MTTEVGSVTMFDDSLQRIRTGQIAQVPVLLGNVQDEGTSFAYIAQKDLRATIDQLIGSGHLSPADVRGLYPGLSDRQVIAAVLRDVRFRWCVLYLVWVEKNNKSNKHLLNKPNKIVE